MKIFRKATLIKAIILLSILFVWIKMWIPNYPEINNNASLEEVEAFVNNILTENAKSTNMQYLDSPSHNPPVEYFKSAKMLMNKFSRCGEDKICIINAYNNFMDNWVSNEVRKKTKAYYMIHKFGFIGEIINNSLWEMY